MPITIEVWRQKSLKQRLTYSSIQNKPHPFQGRSQIQKESPLEQTPGEQLAAKKTIRKDNIWDEELNNLSSQNI